MAQEEHAGTTESIGLSLTKPFHGKGSTVDYATTITTVLAVLIPILIILTHVFQRRRSLFHIVNLLRFASLLALPVFMWTVGSYASFEGAKRVEFCHSCHTAMDMYVNDMHDPDSTTLAALHYKNRYIQEEQCYTCHADYGMIGTAKAKATGLFHLYHWLTDSATARGVQQIKVYSPYQNTFCLHCHAGSERFLKAGDGVHTGIADGLTQVNAATKAPVTGCLDCHAPVHPALAEYKKTHGGAK